MKSTPIAAMLVIAFWSGPCSAQPAPSLPFGLENFHWGMTGKEASVQYPAIAPETHAPSGSPVTDQSGNYIGPFHWRDCTFNLVFYFYQDQLDTITLDARAVSPACLTSIKEEVGAHSGDLATASAYNYVSDVRFAEISLSQRGSRPLVIYDTIPRQRSN